VIDLQEIRKTYVSDRGTEVPVLGGVTLHVARGELVAIMGASGCGKSTLMNLIGTLDRPSSGTYLLAGEDTGRMSDEELSHLRNRRIGFVFQSFNLLPLLSALENVELPLVYGERTQASARRARARQVLSDLGLEDSTRHRPGELSGGQQQRVAIARALVTNPDLILADEPTGNLDSRASLEVMAALQTLWQRGKTLLVVTHEPDIARFAPRVVVLRDGVVVSDQANPGPPSAAEALAAPKGQAA